MMFSRCKSVPGLRQSSMSGKALALAAAEMQLTATITSLLPDCNM